MQVVHRYPSTFSLAPGRRDGGLRAAKAERPGGKVRIGVVEIAALVLAGGGLAGLGWGVSFPLAGGIYAAMLLAATLIRPEIAFLLVFLEAPLVYDVAQNAPVKMAIADITLVIATPVLLIRWLGSGKPVARNPLRWPVVAYFAVCLLSSAANGGSGEAVTSMAQMGLYMVWAVFVFANCVEFPEQVMPAFYGLLATDLVLAVAAVFFSNSGYALGLHKNAVGSEMNYAVIVAAELWLAMAPGRRRQLMAGVLLVLMAGLMNSLSRGAWLGTAAGLMVLLVLRGRVKFAVRATLLLVPVVFACWQLLPKQSRDYATDFGSNARNVNARYESLSYAWDLYKQYPVLGDGVGLRKVYDATNVVLATMAETGTLGLVTFLSIFAAFYWMVWRTRRNLSKTEPAFSLMAIGAALMAAKFVHGCVDHYWSRVMLPVWASAGLAVLAYNMSLKHAGGASLRSGRRPAGVRPARGYFVPSEVEPRSL